VERLLDGAEPRLMVTDPPYGIGIDGQKGDVQNGQQIRKSHEFRGWDDEPLPPEFVEWMLSLCDEAAVFGANYVPGLPAGHKGWVVWDKSQRDLTMSDCEIVFTTSDQPTRIYELHRTAVWQEGAEHPTQKPTELWRYLLNIFPDADHVLDLFCGSGTSIIAAEQEGRTCYAMEIDPAYCAVILERCSEAGMECELIS
jgi:site-specific DNA-methyltransferase (adenine-specific)